MLFRHTLVWSTFMLQVRELLLYSSLFSPDFITFYFHLHTGPQIIQIQIRQKTSYMYVSREVLCHFPGWLSKKISIVSPLLPWFSSCNSLHRGELYTFTVAKRQPPKWAVFSEWDEWLALLGAYNWVFWAGLCRGRGKSRKPHPFLLQAGAETLVWWWLQMTGDRLPHQHAGPGMGALSAMVNWCGKGKVIPCPFLFIFAPLW